MSNEQPTVSATASATPQVSKLSLRFWFICAVVVVLGLMKLTTDKDTHEVPHVSVSALDKAAAVFRGGYSREQIKALLDEVMLMNGVSRSEHEYERWASVLVKMRVGGGGTEMEILRCIKGMQAAVRFPDSAGICAAGKQAGLY